MTWAALAGMMGKENLAKRADARKVEGKRGPKLRWGLINGDLEREEWRKSAPDRRSWRLLKENVEREK